MPNPNLEKVTLNLRRGDWFVLTAAHGARGEATSTVIRALVSNYVDRLCEKHGIEHPSRDPSPEPEIDIKL